MGYQTVETLLDDVSRQMASSNLTRYSRGSTGQRTGGSMRIVKPNSTSNSPRGSIGLGRRRTVMTDQRRRIAMADPNLATPGGFVSNDGLQIPTRSNRPVSWHPSSQMAPQPNYNSAYQVPPLNTQSEFHIFDLPPTPAVYSAYGSPESTFSPLSMPYTGYEQQYPYTNDGVPYQSSNQPYQFNQEQTNTSYTSSNSGNTDSSMYSHFDWSNFATNGFESSTSPPTPENSLPIQHPDATLPADDAIPYHSLSDSEPEGEILQGLGLYDTPEISKVPSSDPQLDNYRSLVMSQLLGTAYRKTEPESTGKGLKLEETWNPPPSDDDDDEDDDEQDGEGEDEDEEPPRAPLEQSSAKNGVAQSNNEFMGATNFLPSAVQTSQGLQHHSSSKWL